jgi:hypothetical protein
MSAVDLRARMAAANGVPKQQGEQGQLFILTHEL